MDRLARLPVFLFVTLFVVAAPAAAEIILDADFEGMTLDQPIGTGGAAVGEPVTVYNCQTRISDVPFTTNCLEISDNADFGTGIVVFEFLDSEETTEGVVDISMKLWFSSLEGAIFYIREQGGAADSFVTLHFTETGHVELDDAAGALGAVGSFQGGQAYDLAFRYDMDAGTYDMWWGGAEVVEGRAHTIADSGIGSVVIGVDHDVDLDGIVWVDDLLVETSANVAGEEASWSAVKAVWR